MATSTSANEKFDLGTGSDTITFAGDFGDDTVVLNDDEKLMLNINENYEAALTTDGDAVLGVDVKYVATAKVAGSLWGNEVGTAAAPKEYTFELAAYNDEQFPVEGLEGKYMWKATTSYGSVDGQDRYWLLDNGLFATATSTEKGYTFSEDGATATEFTIHKYVNGKEVEYNTSAYVEAAAGAVIVGGYDDAPAKNLFDEQTSGTVTIEDFVNRDYYDVNINNTWTYLNQKTFDVVLAGETYTATYLKENISGAGTVKDMRASDSLDFGETKFSELRFGRVGDDLVITDTNSKDVLTVAGYYDNEETLQSVIVKTADDVEHTLYNAKINTIVIDADADNLVFYKNGTTLEIFDKSLDKDADPNAYKAIETLPNFYDADGKTTIAIYTPDSPETDVYNPDLLVLNPATHADATGYPVYFTDAPAVSPVIVGAKDENSYIDAKDALYDLKITANDGAYNVIKAGIGSDVITGGSGVDEIYSGEGNDIVTGGAGADIFNFGSVTGDKVITDATYEDKILTADEDPFSSYGFVRNGDDLVIKTDLSNSITIKDFMKQKEDGSLDVTKNIDDINGKSILANATIDVFVDDEGKYIGTDYNERLTLADGDSVVMGKGDNEVELAGGGTVAEPATHEATVTLTNGESFTFNPVNYDKGVVFEQIIDVTNPKKPKATDDVKLTFTKHNDDGDLLDTFVVTLKGYAAKTNNALVSIGDKLLADYDYLTYAEGTKQLAYDASDVVKNKVTGSDLSDSYDLSAFVSSNGVKGVTINTGAGNDKVVGSDFNDTVKVSSLAGQTSAVAESAGTNKVTFGKGNDEFKADKYSSNNVTMGEGNNIVKLYSTGTNKVTAKNGNNEFKVNAGYNTITAGNGVNAFVVNGGVNTVKSGKGNNSIDISGGLNKVTTGKGNDAYLITDGNNTINSGASATAYDVVTGLGGDQFVIQGGSNTIKSTGSTYVNIGRNALLNNITTGAKNDMFVIAGGVNNIKGGAGHDYYGFTALAKGNNTIITDSKGNDIYDFADVTDFDGLVTISDKEGDDTFVFANDNMDMMFDGTFKYNKKTQTGTFTLGKNVVLTEDLFASPSGVEISGRAADKLNFVDADGDALYTNIDELRGDVEAWFTATAKAGTVYKSVDAVMNSGNEADITALLNVYANFNNDATV